MEETACSAEEYFKCLFRQFSFLPPETVLEFKDIELGDLKGKISFSVRIGEVAIEPLHQTEL